MTTRRIRVVQIVNNLNYGGMERLVADIAKRIDATRFDSHVLALDYLGHFAVGLSPYVDLDVARRMTKWSMVHPRTLAEDIATVGPDIVHLHSGVWYKAGLAAKMARVPFQVYTDHGRQNPDPLANRLIDRRASRRTDVVVAVSHALGARLARIVHDPDRIEVIENGVDTDRYTPGPYGGHLHDELAIDRAAPIIGSVGRLETVKGYDVMIAAYARFAAEWRNGSPPQLVLLGDGSQRAALERLAGDSRFGSSIHFLGWRSDIESAMRGFSLFTMSSHSEGTSVSLLEAMSAGLRPVVTDVGGNAAVLGDGLAHRLVCAPPTPQPSPVPGRRVRPTATCSRSTASLRESGSSTRSVSTQWSGVTEKAVHVRSQAARGMTDKPLRITHVPRPPLSADSRPWCVRSQQVTRLADTACRSSR